MLHCDLCVRWKIASNLRFRAAISEFKTPSFCGILANWLSRSPSTRKSLAIAIVRFWCAKGRKKNWRQEGKGGRFTRPGQEPCSPPLDAREPLTRGIPQPISSWAEKSLNREIPELRLTIPLGSAQGALNRGIPRLRSLSAEGFLRSGVSGIQGWWASKGGSWPAKFIRCVQLAGYFSTKFLRFPRLTAPIFDIHGGNALVY